MQENHCVLSNKSVNGGLVDGPVFGPIFNSLIGIHLTKDDEYEDFQSLLVVYHDDIGDYLTNEPLWMAQPDQL